MIRDGEKIDLCSYAHCTDSDCICKSPSEELECSVGTVRSSAVTLQLRKGFYNDRYRDIIKVYSSAVPRNSYVLFFTPLIVRPNPLISEILYLHCFMSFISHDHFFC